MQQSPSAQLPNNSQLYKQESNFSTVDVSGQKMSPLLFPPIGSKSETSDARFLPDVNTSRRLLKLSITEKSSEIETNPFVV